VVPSPATAFGGFVGAGPSGLPPTQLVCWLDPDEEGLATPHSHHGSLLPLSTAKLAFLLSHCGSSLSFSVSFSGHSGGRSGQRSVGPLLFNGYHGGHSLSWSYGHRGGPGGRLSSSSSGPASSSPSPTHNGGSGGSISDKSNWAASSMDDISISQIPLPADKFTLPPIKTGDDYLKARNLVLFWLHCPGFYMARQDSALVTDARNALASQF
jgi:hypothetical protein